MSRLTRQDESKTYWITFSDTDGAWVGFEAPPEAAVDDLSTNDPMKSVIDFFLELGNLDIACMRHLNTKYKIQTGTDSRLGVCGVGSIHEDGTQFSIMEDKKGRNARLTLGSSVDYVQAIVNFFLELAEQDDSCVQTLLEAYKVNVVRGFCDFGSNCSQ